MTSRPLVEIDTASPVPVYRQIAGALRRHLVEGRLRAGDTLPPIRQLALDLGVHFTTVAQAYRVLSQEGWLDLKRRRGAHVASREIRPTVDRVQVDVLVDRLRDLLAEFRSAGMTKRQVAAALRRLDDGVEL
jgi:GntR family transcriptional regulator